MARLRPLFALGGSASALLALSFQLFSQAPPAYKVWTAGDKATDQGTTVDPNTNMPCHSGVVGWNGGNVRDDAFADMVKPGIDKYIYLFTSFSQCFGDGMFDELAALKGMQSGVSASLHNQLSNYPLATFVKETNTLVYTGNGFDFTFAFNRSMLLPGLGSQKMALFSATNDPWGPSGVTFPIRVGEKQGAEQPVYFASAAAAMTKPLSPRAKNAVVFLWSGQPNLIDQAQIAQMIQYLQMIGYPASSIYAFYGFGMLPLNNPVVLAFGAGRPAAFFNDHLRQANSAILAVYFATKFALPAADLPTYVAFFANDHGFNTCVNNGAATPRIGGDGIPLDMGDPNGVGGGYSTSPPEN